MSQLFFSKHAEQRQAQRGFFPGSIDMICFYGEDVGDGGISISDKEIDALICERAIEAKRNAVHCKVHKRVMQKLDKLRNRKAVLDGNTVITCCCLTKRGRRTCRIRRRKAQ